MKRTSIFSSEYEKKKRRKRRRIAIVVILVLLIASGGALYGSRKLNNVSLKNIFTFKKNDSDSKASTIVKNEEDKKAEAKKEAAKETKAENETKYIDVTLSSGTKVKAVYAEENGTKKFTLVEGLSGGSTFDINKSGSQVIINDASSQEIKIYNLNGEEKNITKANYVTKSGQSFSKDTIMKQYPGYIWSLNAKFLDDTHVVYISQLPWFRKADLDTYVWIMDLNSGVYQTVRAAKGKAVKIETLNDKGITVDIDGSKKTVTSDGNVF